MVKVGIAGVTGMAGEELLKILLGHNGVEITYIGSEHAEGSNIGDIVPGLKGINLKCDRVDAALMVKKADIIMLCKEAGFGMGIAPEILKAGRKVIDLGPDFRISGEAFEKYYKMKHSAPDLLKKAVYGLPEIYRKEIAKASLVANPGCYSTGSILALAPLMNVSTCPAQKALAGKQSVKESELKDMSINIAAYSGFSGSGKKYNEKTKNLFVEAYGNVRPYNIDTHRHIPEIGQFLKKSSQAEINMHFVPPTVPIDRGILSTIFVSKCPPLLSSESKTGGQFSSNVSTIKEVYSKFYEKEPFVRVLPEGETAQTQAVAHTNMCEISLHPASSAGGLIIISAIDNLVKGAAGEAVQNMNIMFGMDEAAGLKYRNI